MSQRKEVILSRFQQKARQIIDRFVWELEGKFPDEEFPVRPPYRRAVYRRLQKLKKFLQHEVEMAIADIEGPNEPNDPPLHYTLTKLCESYVKEFGLRTQKKQPQNV